MSVASSRSGLARHTSSTWPPPRTWARPTSAASSNFSSTIRLLEPADADHVGALAHDERRGCPPRIHDLDTAHRGGQARRGPARGPPAPAAASARVCAGVVPQQPPTTFTQPSSTKRRILQGEALRRLLVLAVLVGQAGVGVDADETGGEARERAEVVGHELGTGRAVEPDGEEFAGARPRRTARPRPAPPAWSPWARWCR